MLTQRRLRGWKGWVVHGGEVGGFFVAALGAQVVAFVVIHVPAL
jgi:hypothetical protein